MRSSELTKVLRAYLVLVFLVVVGFLLFIGFAVGAPSWLTILIAGGAGISYVVGIAYWMRTRQGHGGSTTA